MTVGATVRTASRVLVVDDSAVIRQAISKMLKVDFDVVVANDGEAGWQELGRYPDTAVLITDIEMPRLDGYALICRVRASDEVRVRDLPIIVITGADDDETKARAYACGATDFITKPLNLGQLQACIQAYMRFEQPLQHSEEGLDPVSGLPGRHVFVNRGAELWAQRAREPFALLTIAIDKVRTLYKEYGDARMDQFVRDAAAVIAREANGAFVARLGGADFGVLSMRLTLSEALALGQRIVAAAGRCGSDSGSSALTFSVGVAASEESIVTWDALQQLAEERLKRAVAQGGNQATASALSDTLGSAEELVLDAPPDQADLVDEELVSEALEMGDGDSAVASRSLISLDRILWLLMEGQEALLEPHLDPLIADMVPLLEFLERRRHLGLATAIESLRRAMPPSLSP